MSDFAAQCFNASELADDVMMSRETWTELGSMLQRAAEFVPEDAYANQPE